MTPSVPRIYAPPAESAEQGPAATTEPTPAADAPPRARIEGLPREVGVLLFSVGALGFVVPGMVGAPALVAGGLVLWPGAFGRVDSWIGRRWPDLHRSSMRQIGRFLDDLERRYPGRS